MYLLILAMAGVLAALAVRDHRAAKLARRGLLDGCRATLQAVRVTQCADGFPSLSGFHGGLPVRVTLVPDTMTVRRLPQLWMTVTLQHAAARPGFGVLVRHAGTEFYALTPSFQHRLEPPAGLPWEVVARGDDPAAQHLLEGLVEPLGRILADGRIKEVAVTAKGFRIVRQVGEGRRGEHLLLRQSVFDDADIPAALVQSLLDELDALRATAEPTADALAELAKVTTAKRTREAAT